LTDRQLRLELYRRMYLLRSVTERLAEPLRMGEIGGPLSKLGQEAVSVGSCLAVRGWRDVAAGQLPDLVVGSAARHAMDLPLKETIAEIFGKSPGFCKGKSGPMYLAAPTYGYMGCGGIIGAPIVIGGGMALSAMQRGTGQIVLCLFGDGATNQGMFHEGLNLAAVHKLPIVYVCANNGFGGSSPIEKTTAVPEIADRVSAYNIPGVAVDGFDPLAVYEATQSAAERARAGKGPTLIEGKVLRQASHSGAGPGNAERHEVAGYRRILLNENWALESDLEALETRVDREIEEAIAAARTAPFPEAEELGTDVFWSGSRALVS
jgi:acetoin:2,6-dichlorophenolindophenol oxidoreductase subunit alpha